MPPFIYRSLRSTKSTRNKSNNFIIATLAARFQRVAKNFASGRIWSHAARVRRTLRIFLSRLAQKPVAWFIAATVLSISRSNAAVTNVPQVHRRNPATALIKITRNRGSLAQLPRRLAKTLSIALLFFITGIDLRRLNLIQRIALTVATVKRTTVSQCGGRNSVVSCLSLVVVTGSDITAIDRWFKRRQRRRRKCFIADVEKEALPGDIGSAS